MFRITVVACVVGLIALATGTAQDRTAKVPPDTSLKRTVFTLNHAEPSALSRVLAQQYEGQAKVSVLRSELLVSGPPAVIDEIAAIVSRFDRPPRSVEVTVTL